MRLAQDTLTTILLRPAGVAGGPISDRQGLLAPMASPMTLAAQFLTPPPPLPLYIPALAPSLTLPSLSPSLSTVAVLAPVLLSLS